MNTQSRGYVDPVRWDDGIPAAFVNYNLTGAQTRQSDTRTQSSYLNLRSGANLGPWRLRNISRCSTIGSIAGIPKPPGCSEM
ncbi:fimbrial biogenesis outer membrane usher protein [Raoultella ornithinolytica]|nr:fimbrial biogenesis outer membrane usher protein [Raoultella ornithinolytica]